MSFDNGIILLLLTVLTLVACHCPHDMIHQKRGCVFHIHCIETLENITLSNGCRGSINEDKTVHLTLSQATPNFAENIDKEFLSSIATLTITAYWPNANLSFLEHMTQIKELVLRNNNIQTIVDDSFLFLDNLEHLDLSHNMLTDINDLFDFEYEPNKLNKLYLDHNNICELSDTVFEQLTSLTELDLSNNHISRLDDGLFANLTKLQILRLEYNGIRDLGEALINLHNLKHLYLRGNQIHNFERSMSIIKHLETFDISNNNLRKVKPMMFVRYWDHFDGACKIVLSNNGITYLPNGTSKEISKRYYRGLETNNILDINDVTTELDLSKNKITKIEYYAFQSLLQIISIDLSDNKLRDFIVNTQDLSDVRFLNLSNNVIASLLSQSFLHMRSLTNLDLSQNQLSLIPDETFAETDRLLHLNMSSNNFNQVNKLYITTAAFHFQGSVLDLSNNSLLRLDVQDHNSLKVATLVLHSNKISDPTIINLVYQNYIKTLDMSRNLIQKLDDTSLLLPYSLLTLNLSFNSITDIGPSSFQRVPHLKNLYLRNNSLERIEYGAFKGLTALSNLDLSFNKIRHLESKLLMDLKSLEVISLTSNGLVELDYNGWLGHTSTLVVYLEDNRFSCEWLGKAIQDFNYGFSRMKPSALSPRVSRSSNSIEGVPCIQDDEKFERLETLEPVHTVRAIADERLLVTNQKILETLREQMTYLRVMADYLNRRNGNDSIYTTISKIKRSLKHK